MEDKILVVAVTYNNPVLLEHVFQSYEKFNPGYDCDYLVIDHHSPDVKQKKVLDKLSKKYTVELFENNRVETSFQRAWEKYPDYKYYFFVHDDACAVGRG